MTKFLILEGAWKKPSGPISMIEVYFSWIESGLDDHEFGMLLCYCLALNQKY